jgi:hypothetical protein
VRVVLHVMFDQRASLDCPENSETFDMLALTRVEFG